MKQHHRHQYHLTVNPASLGDYLGDILDKLISAGCLNGYKPTGDILPDNPNGSINLNKLQLELAARGSIYRLKSKKVQGDRSTHWKLELR